MRSIFLITISVICSLAVTDSRPGEKFRGDTVPFMLVVQHTNGPRCAGALVSMRAAVSTASCVSLSQGPITVMAGPYLTGIATIEEAVRRIASVVLPAGYVASKDFAGAVNDVAVLRLEKPFEMSKLVKPILIDKDYSSYATYEKEEKLCNLVRALYAPVTRQRREDMNLFTDTNKSSQITPITRNLDFTVSYEWFNPNNSDVCEVTINKDKLNSTFSEHVIAQSTREIGQNVANTSHISNGFDRSDWLQGEANLTIADSTLESAAIINDTIRIKRNVIIASSTRSLNIINENARKYLFRNVTPGLGKQTPARTATASPPPASDMTIILRIYDVRTLNMDQCRDDNILVGNRQWAAMSEQVMCTHGANFCQTDWGSGLVCNGKLRALLSRVAHPTGQPIDAAGGCGTTHTLQTLGRWKRFLGCAHDRGNCDELPCSMYCKEKTLKLDENYELATLHANLGLKLASSLSGKTERDSNFKSLQRQKLKDDRKINSEYDYYIDSDHSKQKSNDSDDSDVSDDDSSDLSDDEQINQQRNNHKTVKPSPTEDMPKLREQLPVLKEQLQQGEHFTTETSTRKRTVASLTPTRTPKQSISTKSMTKELTQVSSRDNEHNLVEFEPNRADFKAGEYGENVVDYGDNSEDEYVITGKCTNAVYINSNMKYTPSTTGMETSLTNNNISTALSETTLMGDTSVYDLMPKLKHADGEHYKLKRSDATIIGEILLLELVIVFTGYLLR